VFWILLLKQILIIRLNVDLRYLLHLLLLLGICCWFGSYYTAGRDEYYQCLLVLHRLPRYRAVTDSVMVLQNIVLYRYICSRRRVQYRVVHGGCSFTVTFIPHCPRTRCPPPAPPLPSPGWLLKFHSTVTAWHCAFCCLCRTVVTFQLCRVHSRSVYHVCLWKTVAVRYVYSELPAIRHSFTRCVLRLIVTHFGSRLPGSASTCWLIVHGTLRILRSDWWLPVVLLRAVPVPHYTPCVTFGYIYPIAIDLHLPCRLFTFCWFVAGYWLIAVATPLHLLRLLYVLVTLRFWIRSVDSFVAGFSFVAALRCLLICCIWYRYRLLTLPFVAYVAVTRLRDQTSLVVKQFILDLEINHQESAGGSSGLLVFMQLVSFENSSDRIPPNLIHSNSCWRLKSVLGFARGHAIFAILYTQNSDKFIN